MITLGGEGPSSSKESQKIDKWWLYNRNIKFRVVRNHNGFFFIKMPLATMLATDVVVPSVTIDTLPSF